MTFLIVRLGALGDIVHAIPAVAALRRAHPDARIDWLVDARHRAVVDLVAAVDRVVAVDSATLPGWIAAVRALRATRYDVAIDLQGLLKSAVLARASGARKVIGFSIWHLREKTARPFYSETADAGQRAARHRQQPAAARRGRRARHGRRVSAQADRLAGGDDGGGADRCEHALRARQRRRGVAQQALAARALRRDCRLPARGVRPRAGRAVGPR